MSGESVGEALGILAAPINPTGPAATERRMRRLPNLAPCRMAEVDAAERTIAEAFDDGLGGPVDGYYRPLALACIEAAMAASEHPSCAYCGDEFARTTWNQQYCSPNCRCKQAAIIKRRRADARKCRECGGPAPTGRCGSCAVKRGPDSPSWKGGETRTHDGRWLVRRGDKYVLRARAVMEDYLGRRLETREHVHHINRDKTDDRIENLEVLDVAEHARRHWREGSFDSRVREAAAAERDRDDGGRFKGGKGSS